MGKYHELLVLGLLAPCNNLENSHVCLEVDTNKNSHPWTNNL